eukprot:scaffold62126_cov19-Tisochrysis_lutea.AAC.1
MSPHQWRCTSDHHCARLSLYCYRKQQAIAAHVVSQLAISGGDHYCVGLPEANLKNALKIPDQNLLMQKRASFFVPTLFIRDHPCVPEIWPDQDQ